MQDQEIKCEVKKYDTCIFLTKLTFKKLLQICRSFDIPRSWTKERLVKKIIKKCTLGDIKKYIDYNKNKKYFIRCSGDLDKSCEKCIRYNDFLIHCANCDSKHTYFTNTRFSNDYLPIIDGSLNIKRVKCEVCEKMCDIYEYENEFYE